MGRKDNSPTISFFSFQDIITSVTGIMFLVMLILTLMLLLRNMNTAPSPEETVSQELLDKIRDLKDQLARIADNSQELEARVEELKKLDIKTIPLRMEKLRQERKELEERILAALNARGNAAQETQQLEGDTQALHLDVESLREILRKLQQDFTEMTAQKDALEDAAEKSQRMMRFAWDKQLGLTPLLVECSGNAITVGPIDSATPMKHFTGTSTMELQQKFMVWLESQNPSQVYFVFLAKPSGFQIARVLSEAIGKAKFKRGIEVLPTDDTIIFEATPQGGKP